MSDERREKNDRQKEHEKKVFNDDLELTPDEEEALKKKIAELLEKKISFYVTLVVNINMEQLM